MEIFWVCGPRCVDGDVGTAFGYHDIPLFQPDDGLGYSIRILFFCLFASFCVACWRHGLHCVQRRLPKCRLSHWLSCSFSFVLTSLSSQKGVDQDMKAKFSVSRLQQALQGIGIEPLRCAGATKTKFALIDSNNRCEDRVLSISH